MNNVYLDETKKFGVYVVDDPSSAGDDISSKFPLNYGITDKLNDEFKEAFKDTGVTYNGGFLAPSCDTRDYSLIVYDNVDGSSNVASTVVVTGPKVENVTDNTSFFVSIPGGGGTDASAYVRGNLLGNEDAVIYAPQMHFIDRDPKSSYYNGCNGNFTQETLDYFTQNPPPVIGGKPVKLEDIVFEGFSAGGRTAWDLTYESGRRLTENKTKITHPRILACTDCGEQAESGRNNAGYDPNYGYRFLSEKDPPCADVFRDSGVVIIDYPQFFSNGDPAIRNMHLSSEMGVPVIDIHITDLSGNGLDHNDGIPTLIHQLGFTSDFDAAFRSGNPNFMIQLPSSKDGYNFSFDLITGYDSNNKPIYTDLRTLVDADGYLSLKDLYKVIYPNGDYERFLSGVAGIQNLDIYTGSYYNGVGYERTDMIYLNNGISSISSALSSATVTSFSGSGGGIGGLVSSCLGRFCSNNQQTYTDLVNTTKEFISTGNSIVAMDEKVAALAGRSDL